METWTSCLAYDDGHPLENADESGRRLCEYWSSTFQARVEGPRHHQFENRLQHVQKAPDDIRWVIDRTDFDELIAMKKDSAPGPDGIPFGACRCAGGLGSQFLFNADKYLLEGGTVPEHFAESRTVFISKTSDIDVDVVQLRLQDIHHSNLSRPPLVHHEMHTSLAEMHLFQTDDGQHL